METRCQQELRRLKHRRREDWKEEGGDALCGAGGIVFTAQEGRQEGAGNTCAPLRTGCFEPPKFIH